MRKYLTIEPEIGCTKTLATYTVVSVIKENGGNLSMPHVKMMGKETTAKEYIESYLKTLPKEREGMLSEYDISLFLVKFKD